LETLVNVLLRACIYMDSGPSLISPNYFQ